MSAVNPYANTPQAFSATDWKEDAHDESNNGPSVFGPMGGEATLNGNVNFEQGIGALRFFLGYSNITPLWNVGSPPFLLQRTPPVYHPRFPRLVCVNASLQDLRLEPVTNPLPPFNRTIKIPQTPLPPLSVMASPSYNVIDGTPLRYQTSSKLSKLTARFAPVPYRMLEDEQVSSGGATNGEWLRYCYIDQEPRAEVLSLTGFNQTYFEGEGYPTPPTLFTPISNPKGNQYPSEIGQVIVKSDLRVTWVNVPEEWVFWRDPSTNVLTQYPKNILMGLGTINQENWNGFLAGTLLLTGAKFTRRAWPLAAGTESRYNYDIEFQMSYFDPPKGYSYIGGVTTQLNRIAIDGEPLDLRGHNCFPWRGSGFAGDINAGLWFGASFDGGDPTTLGSTSEGLYRQSLFDNLFNSPLNPYRTL